MSSYKNRRAWKRPITKEMGTGWSEDGPLESQATETQSSNIKSETEETDAQAGDGRLFDTKAKTNVQVKLPHNYEAVLRDADPPIDRSSDEKLHDQLCNGVFLNQKRKKYWVGKNNENCFILFARDLSITWAEDGRYWQWPFAYEKSDTLVEVDVAEVLNVCWLEVHGRFDITKLTPGILYEVVFLIMLRDLAYGWEVPVNLRLILPNGTKQEHKEKLVTKARGQWIEIPVGEFKTSPESCGEMEISMFEYDGGQWKRGLVIKGIAIRPKN